MAPLHPNDFEYRSLLGNSREDRFLGRAATRISRPSSDSSHKRGGTPRKNENCKRQERHFMQRSDAYLTSRELSAPKPNFRASAHLPQRQELSRSGDYRRSLVLDRKVEVQYGYITKPIIPEVDYLTGKEVVSLTKKTSNIFREELSYGSSARLDCDSFSSHCVIKPSKSFGNLTKLKSSLKLEIRSSTKEKPSNLKSALKLSKSDSRLNSKLEVRWDSDSETKAECYDTPHSPRPGSRDRTLNYNEKKSPSVNRRGSKPISKSISKSSPLFVCKRSALHYSSARAASSKRTSRHIIPRARTKNSPAINATYKMPDSLFYDVPRIRLDGGARAFRKRWGYDMPHQPPTLLEEDGECGEDLEDPYSRPYDGDGDNVSFAETRSLREDYCFSHSWRDTSYEKACGSDRRGSAPATPILGGGRSPLHTRNDNASPNGGGGGGPNTPSQGRLANFFSKRSIKNLPLKRTKSVTKLERSKRGGTGGPISSNQNFEANHNDETSSHADYPAYQHPSHHLSSTNLHGTGNSGHEAVNGGGPPIRLRSSQSHESLLSSRDHQMMSTLDLNAGEAVIRPLHDSVLGQKYCFQIKAPKGTKYYSCRSEQERDKWVESLRRAINQHPESKSRVHNSINITIVEAKGIPAKKQYFCELRLDDDIYGRTSAKMKSDLCFWGEQFEFKCLPTVHTVTIVLWREANKRRKAIPREVGKVQIPVNSVTGRNVIEKWYAVVPPDTSSSKNSNKNATASIRIKCSYQTVNILPVNMYREFHEFLLTNYSGICSLLEPVVSVATKADVATTLVHLTQHSQLATKLISDIVLEEIAKNDDCHLIFRGNSVGTKAMEAFMKLVGETYLRETLEPAINKIILSDYDCEVDPKKVSNEALIPKNRKNLISHVSMTWNRIILSPLHFPLELRECFKLFRQGLSKLSKEALGDKLISASIFLRFLCPAILNPILFRLTHELPNEKVTRNLTLVAKTLQTLANFTKFQGKEEFMEFMNDFIQKEQSEMKEFLKKISSERETDVRTCGYGGNIDPGIQLSVLQTLLAECLPNMKPESEAEIRCRDTLKRLIDDLDNAKDNPNNDLVQTLVAHEDSGSASNSTTATVVDHQKREDKRNQLRGINDNVFRYNDPTASFSSKHSGSSCHVDEMERETKPQNGNSDPNDRHGRRKDVLSPKSNFRSQKDGPTSSRSSTLPRSSYLVSSGRTPAMDLHTDDDYVHYSALTSNNENIMPKGGPTIGHSFSQSHIPSDSPNGTFQQAHRNHHRHFHNHTALFNSANGGVNGTLYNSPSFSQVSNSNQNQQIDQLQAIDSLNSSHDCDHSDSNIKGSQTSISQLSNVVSSGYQSFAYSQSSSPVDPTITDVANNNNNNNNVYDGSPNTNNRKNGNQSHQKSSSNHISNQSNRYLNEPISIAQMPQITQVKQPTAQVALAFNNPTYQMDSLATSSPRSNNKIHPKQNLHHHFLVNGSVLPHNSRAYPLSHSQSSHAAGYSSSPTSARVGYNGHQCNSSLSSAQSVEDLVCNRVTLSGSDDTSSLVSTTSTPPQSTLEINPRLNFNPNSNGYAVSHTQPAHRIHAHNSYKSSAPRTNPRCLPTPAWQQLQAATTNLHSSINNLSKPEEAKNPHLDHHHSTSDLLSTSSYSQPRRAPHKNTRRQSAEFGSARQRYKLANNYDSTSDDTSSDERQQVTTSSQYRSRLPAAGPAAPNKSSGKRTSDNKTLDEYEHEINSMKKILENLENEVKEHQDPKGPSSPSNKSFSSCNLSTSPPSPASMLPSATRCAEGRTSLSEQYPASGGDLNVAVYRDSFDEDQKPPVTHLAHGEPTEELIRQLLEDQAKKDAVIAAQKEKISHLDVSNSRLLQAYHDLSQRMKMLDFDALGPESVFMEASAPGNMNMRREGGDSSADGSKYSDPSPHSSDYNGSSC